MSILIFLIFVLLAVLMTFVLFVSAGDEANCLMRNEDTKFIFKTIYAIIIFMMIASFAYIVL